MDEQDRRIRNLRILGIAFGAAGFVGIALGYHGMARAACVDCQMPYLLSGGIGGLALVLLGLGLMVMAEIASEGRKTRAAMRAEGTETTPVPAVSLDAPATTATHRRGSAAGHAGNADENGRGVDAVVLGRSSYHRPDCRLVKDKEDLARGPVSVAQQQGLSPCRLCSPAREPQFA